MKEENKTLTVCWQCGKRAPVNISGVCEDCWKGYAYLRRDKAAKW